MERQPSRKRESEAWTPKRKVCSGGPRRIACTTQRSETADENMSGKEAGWTGVDRERERVRNQMRLVRDTQAHCRWSTHYLSPTVSFSKPLCANVHYQPLASLSSNTTLIMTTPPPPPHPNTLLPEASWVSHIYLNTFPLLALITPSCDCIVTSIIQPRSAACFQSCSCHFGSQHDISLCPCSLIALFLFFFWLLNW